MSGGHLYVLDANVFIQAARSHYAFDLVPGFWVALLEHARAGHVCSIDHVKKELLDGNDDLAQWARTEFAFAFKSTDRDDVFEAYREIIAWSQQQSHLMNGAKADFARGADGWLVAYARVTGGTVVTHERYNPACRRRVLIPNVCRVFNVPVVDTYAMLRALGVRLG